MNHVLLQLFQSRCHIASVICFIGDFPFPYAIFLFTIGSLLEATLHLCVSECVYVLKLDLTIYIESFIFRRVLNQFPLFSFSLFFSLFLHQIDKYINSRNGIKKSSWRLHENNTFGEWLHIFMLRHFRHFATCMPSFEIVFSLAIALCQCPVLVMPRWIFYPRDK